MSSQRGLTFWGTVGAVWTALKLKKEYDEYNAVSTDDPEGRIQLPNSAAPGREDDVSLLDTNIRVRREKKKPSGCCMCCGIDCTLFWKAIGIVVGLWAVYGVFRFARWALTPTPTGLEGMPVFGANLGCEHASVYLKDSGPAGYILKAPTPPGEDASSHSVKFMGSGVGTITIVTADAGEKDVTYKIVMKGTDKPLLDLTDFIVDQGKYGSTLAFHTPQINKLDIESGEKCIRFDVVLSIPPELNNLYIAGYSTLQVKFDEGSHLDFERLSVVLSRKDSKNMILPHADFHASDDLNLEVTEGWIVGDVSVAKQSSISTQRGAAVSNVKIHPTTDVAHLGGYSGKANFRSATGIGRSDFFYISDKANKRTIESHHISSLNGDVYLRYGDSHFDGKIALSTRTSTIWGAVTDLKNGRPGGSRPPVEEGDSTDWTHVRGDGQGKDKLFVDSNGWTGLYF